MRPARDPAIRASVPAMAREPLLWASAAAFTGAVLGLLGTFWQARLLYSFDLDPTADFSAAAMQACGQTLAALSLLGVPALLDASRPAGPRTVQSASRLASMIGVPLLAALTVASAAEAFYQWYLHTPEMARNLGPPPGLATASFWAAASLPAAVVLPFALVALPHRRWLGALLLVLCALTSPFGFAWFLLFPENLPSAGALPILVALGVFGWGVGALEAPVWGLLGATLFRGARERALGREERRRGTENLELARRLYEAGLGRGDASVVGELVSEDFRDPKSGARGKSGMRRLLEDLRATYPDLAVSVLHQEADGDLVRTRVLLSGTDRGRGVMWYPPTGRRVSFEAEFADRFRGGALVEHAGEADTEGLLEQLGHHRGVR